MTVSRKYQLFTAIARVQLTIDSYTCMKRHWYFALTVNACHSHDCTLICMAKLTLEMLNETLKHDTGNLNTTFASIIAVRQLYWPAPACITTASGINLAQLQAL